MDLDLTFANGSMSGTGSDNVGPFSIKGRYDPANQECHWTKSYLGAHDVFYRGFREGKGIWGTWEITVQSHGGFHIWPRAAGESHAVTVEERKELVDAVAALEAPKSQLQDPVKHQAPSSKSAEVDPVLRQRFNAIPREFEMRNLDLGSWILDLPKAP